MADHLDAGVADDHLLFVGQHFDALADQRRRHQIARRPESNTAALVHGALFPRA
jgi:hypothetical protein